MLKSIVKALLGVATIATGAMAIKAGIENMPKKENVVADEATEYESDFIPEEE